MAEAALEGVDVGVTGPIKNVELLREGLMSSGWCVGRDP